MRLRFLYGRHRAPPPTGSSALIPDVSCWVQERVQVRGRNMQEENELAMLMVGGDGGESSGGGLAAVAVE
ncbi:hypothetical protein AKJ16_DCAP19309 [Drosera capensis]